MRREGRLPARDKGRKPPIAEFLHLVFNLDVLVWVDEGVASSIFLLLMLTVVCSNKVIWLTWKDETCVGKVAVSPWKQKMAFLFGLLLSNPSCKGRS